MLSSDKNVENIAQLVQLLKDYAVAQKEYVKLDIVEKIVRLSTALILAITLLLLTVAVLFYLSFAVVHWLAPLTGLALAYFLVSMTFLVLLVLVYSFRKSWIERPLVRFLAETLLS